MIAVSTFADLQAAINVGEPSIDINGVLSGGILQVSQNAGLSNQNGMTRIRGGHLDVAGICIGSARRMKLEGVEVFATGHALQVANAIHVFVEDCYFKSPTICLAADGIAGMWVRGSHFQGQGGTTFGIRVGDSASGYEALDVAHCIFEACQTDVRIGGPANCVNLRFAFNWHDRPVSAGYLIAPKGTAGGRNIRITSEWFNGAQYPVCVSMGETTGRVDRLVFDGAWELLGCGSQVTTYGAQQTDIRNHAVVVSGPLEPG